MPGFFHLRANSRHNKKEGTQSVCDPTLRKEREGWGTQHPAPSLFDSFSPAHSARLRHFLPLWVFSCD